MSAAIDDVSFVKEGSPTQIASPWGMLAQGIDTASGGGFVSRFRGGGGVV